MNHSLAISAQQINGLRLGPSLGNLCRVTIHLINELMNVTNQRSNLNVLHIKGDERIDVNIMMLAGMDLSHLFHLFANHVVQLARVHI